VGDGVKKALAEHAKKPKVSPASVLQEAIDAFDNSGVKAADRGKYFDDATREQIAKLAETPGDPARIPATTVALWWNDAKASASARAILADPKAPSPTRSMLLKALAQQKSAENIGAFSAFVTDNAAPVRLRQDAVAALGSMDDVKAANVLVDDYAKAEPADLKPMIIDALVQSKAGSAALLSAAKEKRIPQSQITENHARRIAGYNDEALSKELSQTWGTIRN